MKWVRRVGVGLGILALCVVVLETLALVEFVSRLVNRPGNVVYFGVSVAELGALLATPVGIAGVGLLLGILLAGIYLTYDDIVTGVSEFLRAVGEYVGLLQNPDELVKGCIVHDDVRWVGNYLTHGRVEIERRECPSCALKLQETHLPEAVFGDRTDDDGRFAEDGRLFAGIVRDSEHAVSGADSDTYVDALACPHCSFTVRGTPEEMRGNDAAATKLRDAFERMQDGGREPFGRWRHRATQRLGRSPKPGDLWDEYALTTETPHVKYVNIVDRDGRESPAPSGTYPALHSLRESASDVERVIDGLPDRLAVVLNWVAQSDYLERRDEHRARRQSTANELTRQVARLRRASGTQLERAILAKESGTLPEGNLDALLETTSQATATLTSLRQELPDDYLTNSEKNRLSTVITQLEETDHYLVETIRFEERWDAIESKREQFDERYAPYTDGERYMLDEDQRYLDTMASHLLTELRTLRRDADIAAVPGPYQEQLTNALERFDELTETLPRYNDATEEEDGFDGFVERQRQQYADLLKTEHGALNPAQQRAVIRNDRYNLVDASAGTGKTLTLTYRFLYLVERGVPVNDIVAMTFTTEAAREMKTRISDELPGVDSDDLDIRTIHSLAREIARDSMLDPPGGDWEPEGYVEQYAQGFVDGADWVRDAHPECYATFRTERANFEQAGESYIEENKREGETVDALLERTLEEFITTARSFGLTPEDIRSREDIGPEKQVSYRFALLGAAVLEAYFGVVEDPEDAADFADYVETAGDLIAGNPGVYETDYSHILVDEFQDVASSDIAFIEALREATGSTLFCVGDDWQSIYGFRGSTLSHFTEFERGRNSVSTTTLAINYRCPPAVVKAGEALMHRSEVDQNEKAVRAHKEIETQPTVHRLKGEPYTYHGPKVIADQLEAAHDDGYAWEEMMVLSRDDTETGHLSRVREALDARDIPHRGPKEPERDAVVTQTVHKSKGTEAPVVILANATEAVDGGLPPGQRIDKALRGAIDSQTTFHAEERRLFYVALTRAEERFHAVTKVGNVSRYIGDIVRHFEFIDHELEALTGEVSNIRGTNDDCWGELDCEELGVELSFAAVPWELEDGADATADIKSRLEAAKRVQFTNVRDDFDNQYPRDILLTDESTVEVLDESGE